MASNVAVLKYYARLIKKGSYTMNDVPKEDQEAVKKYLEETPDPKFDPETQTPEITDKDQQEEEKEEEEVKETE